MIAKILRITLPNEQATKLSDMLKESGWECRPSVSKDSFPQAIFCTGSQIERPFEEFELDIGIEETIKGEINRIRFKMGMRE